MTAVVLTTTVVAAAATATDPAAAAAQTAGPAEEEQLVSEPNKLADALPFTDNKDPGVVVPMPTLPLAKIVMRVMSLLALPFWRVPNTNLPS